MSYACTRRKCPLLLGGMERAPVRRCTAKNCPDRTITNADKIRAMTDEELADWLEPRTCQYGWLDWLKQEVADGT